MNEPYMRPILSVIYDILGFLVLIAAVVAIVLNLSSDSQSSAVIFWGSVGIVIAIFYFGIAQVVDFLGRTAHYSQKTCGLIENYLVLQSQTTEMSGQEADEAARDRRLARLSSPKQRSSTDETDEAPTLASLPEETEIDDEEQAKQMFARARQHAQDGRNQQAVSGLQEIVKRFPHTQTAEQARRNLQKQARRNLQKSRTPE